MPLVLDGNGDITGLVAGALPSNVIGAGGVLQVVNATYSVETNSSSSTYADTGLTASITPTSSSSKILVLVSQNGCLKQTNDAYMELRLMRDATSISEFGGQAGAVGSGNLNNFGGISLCYLDSPATTSSTTYKTQLKSEVNNAQVRVQNNGAMSTITLIEVAA